MTERVITFFQWLKKTQTGEQSDFSSLTQNLLLDACWPADSDDYITLRNHVRSSHENYGPDIFIKFEQAWEEYQTYTLKELQVTPIKSQATVTQEVLVTQRI